MKMTKTIKEQNLEKIYNLQKALETIGIATELDLDMEWYCIDNKVHYGIELFADIPIPEQEFSLCFTPDGNYITNCLDAPIKKK